MRKQLSFLLLAAMLLLGGCASEQTTVKKISEPDSMPEQVTVTQEEAASVLAVSPDNDTLLLETNGGLTVRYEGKEFFVSWTDLSPQAAWSPNGRYACLYGKHSLLLDTAEQKTLDLGTLLTACFNADQTTLYYVRPGETGSVFLRRKGFADTEELLLEVEDTLHGPMYRTTRSQYLVMGASRLLSLEQDAVGQPWKVRVIADFTTAGMQLADFGYSSQTGLCVVSGNTDNGRVFSVVSPDGKDSVVDKVSCFTPANTETPVTNLGADELSTMSDAEDWPVSLSSVQLSPGGLYLFLLGQGKADHQTEAWLLNLENGALSVVSLPEGNWQEARWCVGSRILLRSAAGQTTVISLDGWYE